MVTILKVDNVGDNNQIMPIVFDFQEKFGVSPFDKMLIREVGEHEYLYLFMNQEELNAFINLMLEQDMTIHSKTDYTEKLISLIINNKLHEFTNMFEDMFDIDAIISEFYNSNITKDNVLDKAIANGFGSLSENDYRILKQAQ